MDNIMLLAIANKVCRNITYTIAEELTTAYKDDDHSSFIQDYAFVEAYVRFKLGRPQASSPSTTLSGLEAARYISEN